MDRYHSGTSKRLKEKFTYLGTGKDFMYLFSLKAEEELAVSQYQKLFFGGDNWITSGIKDYFPHATYLLCRCHLLNRLRECLARRKTEQKMMKNLLLANQIDAALVRIEMLLVHPYDLKEKDRLEKLYLYISRNRQGISNQVKPKDRDMTKTGAIEFSINQAITTRFKKRSMSWSKKGALSFLKFKETMLNGK